MLDLIHRLPPGYQTIFNLFAIEGFSHKEIGAMLRITEKVLPDHNMPGHVILYNK